MPFELPAALLDAGGWVFAAFMLAAILWAIVKGRLVPGVTHEREVARADKATASVEKGTADLAQRVEALATSVQVLTEAVGKGFKRGIRE